MNVDGVVLESVWLFSPVVFPAVSSRLSPQLSVLNEE